MSNSAMLIILGVWMIGVSVTFFFFVLKPPEEVQLVIYNKAFTVAQRFGFLIGMIIFWPISLSCLGLWKFRFWIRQEERR